MQQTVADMLHRNVTLTFISDMYGMTAEANVDKSLSTGTI